MSNSADYFDLLSLLRTGQRWQLNELASRLGKPVAAVRKQLDAMVASGLPIAGDDTRGWQLVGLIDLPPLTLTLTELNALQVALHSLQNEDYGNLSTAAAYVLDKIEDGLPLYLQEFDPIEFEDNFNYQADDETVEAEVLAQRAIAQQCRLSFRYVDADQVRTRRTVRPLHVEGSGVRSKLVAWCELRQDFRLFRLERTDQLELGEPFEPQPGQTYADYLSREA